MIDDPSSSTGASSRPGLFRTLAHRLAGDTQVLPVEGRTPPFDGATGWLNTVPLTPDGLRGRVVLVDFWTYTCVNWLRTAPYLRAWDAKYRSAGLTIVGVHTPEFGFERTRTMSPPRSPSSASRIRSPSTMTTAYGAPSGPLLAGHLSRRCRGPDPLPPLRRGRVRDDRDGHPAAPPRRRRDPARPRPRRCGAARPRGGRRLAHAPAPESYLGYRQANAFAQEDVARFDQPAVYRDPGRLPLNAWGLRGTWTVAGHAAVSHEPGDRIDFRFQARDVNLVMVRSPPGRPHGSASRWTDSRSVMPGHRYRHGRHGQRPHADHVPARPPVGAHRRAHGGHRVPRAGVEAYCFTFG